jgi:hypothetical protein
MLSEKYLVVRRDGSVPKWPKFVLGARDPAAPAALRAYAQEAEKLGMDAEYVSMVESLANHFEHYRAVEGGGDPDSPPLDRSDDPAIVEAMGGNPAGISVYTDSFNRAHGFDATAKNRL